MVEQGGVVQVPVEDIGKPIKKTGKAGPTGSTGPPGVAAHPKPVGGVLPTAGGGGSMVMASVLPSSKSQVMVAAKSGKGVLQVTAPPQPCEYVSLLLVVKLARTRRFQMPILLILTVSIRFYITH